MAIVIEGGIDIGPGIDIGGGSPATSGAMWNISIERLV